MVRRKKPRVKVKVKELGTYHNPIEEKKAIKTAGAIILITALVSLTVFFLLNPPTPQEETEVLKAIIDNNQYVYPGAGVQEVRVWKGEQFTLSAYNSTGDIVEYRWDMDASIDRDKDGNARNDRDKTGPEITYQYERGGQYTVVLWVFDSHGNFDKIQIKVRVSIREVNIDGETSSPSDMVWDHQFIVPSETEAATSPISIKINITYPKGSIPENNLNITVYDGAGNEVTDAMTELIEEEGTKKYIWVLEGQWLAGYDAGTWTLEVTQISPAAPYSSIDFTADIYVYYW